MELSPGLDAHLRVRRGAEFTLDLPLFIPPGTTVALLGPNGAGKSTAVAALAGLLALDGGRIALAGTVLDDPEEGVFVPPEARRVGVVFQDRLLFPHLTVVENVAFGLRSRGSSPADAHRRASAWIERLGVTELAPRRPGTLSGGQAQRVALARALATDPDLLLLDEPLAALDVAARGELRGVLARHLEAFSGPRLLITHDPAVAFQLAHRVHLVEAGTVTQEGSPDEIRLRPRTSYAADVAGANLVTGRARDGEVDTGELTLSVAEPGIRGPVRLTLRPSAVSLHRARPEGSPRNRWATEVVALEDHGPRVRVRLGPPLPLTVEITPAARADLKLEAGVRVWASVKATDIGVEPEEGPRPADGPRPRGPGEAGP